MILGVSELAKKIVPIEIDVKKLTTESPLEEYSKLMDKILEDNVKSSHLSYAEQIHESNPHYFRNLLITDWKYRAEHQMNVVMSIEGQQGKYKSLFGITSAYIIGDIFGVPFDMRKNLYAFREQMNEGYKNGVNRSTHLLDEQSNLNVGIGSQRTALSLIDKEEQLRYSQKNLIYISPHLKEHSHYFIFKAWDYTRIENPKCPCNPDCQKNKWKTQCGIPFWERTGYPKSMTFLLSTPHRLTGYPIPRGFIQFPMPTPETMILYDEIKAKNVKLLESGKEDAGQVKRLIVKNFLEKNEKDLLILTGQIYKKIMRVEDKNTGKLVPRIVNIDNRHYSIPRSSVLSPLLTEFIESERSYTKEEIKEMVALISFKLKARANVLNEELRRKQAEEQP